MRRVPISGLLFALPALAGGQGANALGPAWGGVPHPPGVITNVGFAQSLSRTIQGQTMRHGYGHGSSATPYLGYGTLPVYYFVGVPVVVNQTFVSPPPELPPPDAALNQVPGSEQEEPVAVLSGYQAPAEQADEVTPAQASNAPASPPAAQSSNSLLKPTLYLIAMKTGSVQMAVAYWYEDGALHYVGKDHQMHQAALDDVDPDLSRQLNSERGIDFHFPDQEFNRN